MKKTLKALSLLMVWVILASFIPSFPVSVAQPVMAAEAEAPANDFTWLGTTITKYIGTATTVVIPSNATSIGTGAFSSCSSLTSITIPSSVTSIGDTAFEYCTSLTSIIIPSSVTSIGYAAFEGCSGLTSITIPASVTSIGSMAFSVCHSLTSVTILSSVTSIGSGAFYDTPWLTNNHDDFVIVGNVLIRYQGSQTSITIPSNVTSIGGGAFQTCTNLTTISIPNSVTSIGAMAFADSSITSITIPSSVTSIADATFEGCSKLTSVTIPASVTSIGYSAFAGCSSLTSITIPSSVTSIADGAFGAGTSYQLSGSLASINVDSANTHYASQNGILYNKNLTTLVRCPVGKSGTVTIPGTVTSIADSAFDSCSSLTSVTIPNSVTSIGSGAFASCSNLATISIPSSVTSIGGGAFSGTPWLTSCVGDFVIVGSHVLIGYKGPNAKSNTTITIPDGVTSIGSYAFAYYTYLTGITIPSSVTSIGSYAFYDCSSLTHIDIPAGVTTIAAGTFSGCSKLSVVDIPNTVTSIGNNAFDSCSVLEITIPDGVTSIGNDAFVGCYQFGPQIPSSVTSIGSEAFKGCGGYSNITIPSGIKSIADSAFSGCSGLHSVTIPNSVTSIGDYAFSGCAIGTVTIPASVTHIGSYAFQNCSLGTVALPFSVTSLGAAVFNGSNIVVQGKTQEEANTLLANASVNCTISVSVTTDDDFIWNGNTIINYHGASFELIPSRCTRIANSAFSTYGLTSIVIPASVTSIEENAFLGCSSLTSIFIQGKTQTQAEVFLAQAGVPSGCLIIGASITANSANQSIAAAKALLPSTFVATYGTDTNLLTMLNGIAGMAATGTTLTLVSSNANVANDGTITYTSSAVTGNVVVHIYMTNGTEATMTIAVTTPAHTATAADLANQSIAAAKALIPSTFTATEGTDTNLLTMLNGINGMAATGTTLTLATLNANIPNDGTINYALSAVTGNVVVHINKINGTEDTKTIAVNVPAHSSTEPNGNVGLSSSTYSVKESDGNLVFTVNRTGNSNKVSTVDYATSDNTAIAGKNYVAGTGTLTFASGETSKTINIRINDEGLKVNGNTFNLTLSNPVGASLATTSSAVVTIIDTTAGPTVVAPPTLPVEPAGSLQFSSATSSGYEGQNVGVTITRTGGTKGVIGVSWSVAGSSTAVSTTDFSPDTTNTSPLSFADGETSKTLTFAIPADTANSTVRAGKTIILNLSTPTGNASLGSQTSTAITLSDYIPDTKTSKNTVKTLTALNPTIALNPGDLATGLLSATLNNGVSFNLNSADSGITWKSANTKIATVSNGVITAVNFGSTKVTVIYGGKNATFTVNTALQALSGVDSYGTTIPETKSGKTIPPLNLNINATDTILLSATNVNSVQAYVYSGMVWTTSSSKVATVDNNGVITTTATPGTATITGAYGGKKITAKINTSLADFKLSYPITDANFTPSSSAAKPAVLNMKLGGVSKPLVLTTTLATTALKDVAGDSLTKWTTSNSKVASVDKTGIITTTLLPGTASITGTYCGKSAKLTVNTVLTSLIADHLALNLEPGGSPVTVALSVYYADKTFENVASSATWSSPSAKVATVSNGVVTPVGAGTATITAKFGGKTVTIKVNTNLTLRLSDSSVTLTVAATKTPTLTANYSDGTTEDVTAKATWLSSNSSVASVTSAGLITGVNSGSATISATYLGVKSKSITVKVTK